jgi:hypothetical protein
VLRGVNQPAQDSIRIDLKDASHSTDAEAFVQSRESPHPRVGIDLLAVKWGAVRLEEIPVAAQTHELAPAASGGMTVGADITEADPAVIRTGGMRAKMAGSIDLAATASGQVHTGWRRAGYVRLRPDWLRTRLTIGLASEAYKRLGFTRWSGRFAHRWRGVAAVPKPTEQETQEDEENTCERVETQVRWHDQPLYSGSQ